MYPHFSMRKYIVFLLRPDVLTFQRVGSSTQNFQRIHMTRNEHLTRERCCEIRIGSRSIKEKQIIRSNDLSAVSPRISTLTS